MYKCLFTCVSVYYAWCLRKSEKDGRSSGSEFIDDWEILYGCKESNTGHLQEEQVLSTIQPMDLSFQTNIADKHPEKSKKQTSH